MERQMVVAKYCEDVGWLSKVRMPILVYDKYPEKPLPWPTEVLPNHVVGREAHTYLYHIVNRFDDLAETTIFTQGSPFTHVDHFFEIIQEEFNDTTPLSHHRNWHTPPIHWRWRKYSLELGGCRWEPWIDEIWYEVFPDRKHVPRRMIYGPGAIYAVPKRRIYERGLGFFRRLLAACEREENSLNAWKLELIWCYIFGKENFNMM